MVSNIGSFTNLDCDDDNGGDSDDEGAYDPQMGLEPSSATSVRSNVQFSLFEFCSNYISKNLTEI
jgi:hypothetical protein